MFVINIENKGYQETWGDASKAPYLARTLRAKGVLLNYYYATAHNSLPNYIAQISGQAPNISTQIDCQTYSAFTTTGPDQDGQAVGSGCIYPADGPDAAPAAHRQRADLAGLHAADEGDDAEHPAVGELDPTQHATPFHNYAVRHDPFMYFESIIGDPTYCKDHVRRLWMIKPGPASTRAPRPNLSYISPDLCRDGHDEPCVGGQPGGLVSVDAFLKRWVPRILDSPAFKQDGALVITADESDSPNVDSTACCNEQPGPNALAGNAPGIVGPGGGRIGALVISQWSRPGSWSTTPYNHYSLLGSLEDIFSLPRLGHGGPARARRVRARRLQQATYPSS